MNPQGWTQLLTQLREGSRHDVPQELLARAVDLGHDVASDTVGCSLTELDGARYRTPAASNELARTLDHVQYAEAAGPCMLAARDRQTQRIDALAAEVRFPGFVAAAQERGVRSLLSVPVTDAHHPTALNLYSTRDAAFATERARTTANLLARIIAALTASAGASFSEATDVIAARRNGARVGAAVDLLVGREGIDEAAAFGVLTRRSRMRQVSVHTIVEELLDGEEELQ